MLLLSALPLCGVLGYCNWWIVTKIRSCYKMKKINYQLLPDFLDHNGELPFLWNIVILSNIVILFPQSLPDHNCKARDQMKQYTV